MGTFSFFSVLFLFLIFNKGGVGGRFKFTSLITCLPISFWVLQLWPGDLINFLGFNFVKGNRSCLWNLFANYSSAVYCLYVSLYYYLVVISIYFE